MRITPLLKYKYDKMFSERNEPICLKPFEDGQTQHRKDSLRLTLKKFKLFKLISTLEIIFIDLL